MWTIGGLRMLGKMIPLCASECSFDAIELQLWRLVYYVVFISIFHILFYFLQQFCPSRVVFLLPHLALRIGQ